MEPQDRIQTALQKIGNARSTIIRVAAEWQAAGQETSPLAGPLCDIQEALSQLETLSASLSTSLSTKSPTAFVPRAAQATPARQGS